MERPLEGRVALVTGAGVRVGRAIALDLAAAGADVAVHYRRSGEAALGTAEAVRGQGCRAVALGADLTDADQVEALFQGIDRALGGLDVLVNSAAILARAPLAGLPGETWGRALEVNLTAPLRCALAAAPRLRRRGGGAIVNVVDVAGLVPWRGHLAHCVSKAGLAMLTRCLALELAPEIRVNAVAPGTVLLPEEAATGERQRLERRIPLGRLGAPEDVARAVRFLVCEAPYTTGQVLAVDGGRSLA